jgi:hypothetical protein
MFNPNPTEVVTINPAFWNGLVQAIASTGVENADAIALDASTTIGFYRSVFVKFLRTRIIRLKSKIRITVKRFFDLTFRFQLNEYRVRFSF